MSSYDDLATVIEQVMEKSPWFHRIDSQYGDMPAHELDNGTLHVSSPKTPAVALTEALELCDSDVDSFRALTPIFNAELFRAYGGLCESGIEGEAIYDSPLYERLITEGRMNYLDDEIYGLRAVVESVFAAIKQRFGETLRARTWFGQFRELVL